MTRTTEQNRRLYALLSQTGWESQKADLAWSFSDGRTDKTSELTVQECARLINALAAEAQKQDKAKEKKRRTVFSRLYDLGWTNAEGRADAARLNEFLKSDKAAVKKPLNRQTMDELSRTIAQFDSMVKKHVSK